MKNIFRLFLLGILTSPLLSSEFITIGTGGVTGTYYPTGGAICKFVNQYKKDSKIRCSVESTDGSLYNINGIKNGELDFGIVQSDIVYQAVEKDKKSSKLRSVMAIYPELLTLVTKNDSNINNLLDIKGKRINLGNSGSGNETTALTLLKEAGIKKEDLKLAATFNSSEMPDALKNNQIDGYFYMVGHPTANIKDAASSVNIRIIPIEDIFSDSLVKKYPYFSKSIIEAGTYKGQSNDIQTFGVKAVLVTSEDVDENIVYFLVKAILENFDEFKKLHPAYANLTKESLLEGIAAPLHDGAKRYYEKNGLLK